MAEGGLGRRIPTDWRHVAKFPLSAVQPETVATVERILLEPSKSWRRFYDQGHEGACVGFAGSQVMSILNSVPYDTHYYDARWLWNQAKMIDEWTDTNPGDDNGTSVRAAMDVLRAQGHVRMIHKKTLAAAPGEGILANRWATTVDEVRTCIANGIPVELGINWYSLFDRPKQNDQEEWWIPADTDLGHIRGGHAICVIGASDLRQAVQFPNSWGLEYPVTWMPYAILSRVLHEDGEATIISDR